MTIPRSFPTLRSAAQVANAAKREVPDYAATGIPRFEMESPNQRTPPVLTDAQIAKARRVARLGREILDKAHAAVRPGITTDELDRVVHDATVEAGAYPAPLNYRHFPKSVCTSVNEVVCHGIPDDRELRDGDIVNVDISLILDGYYGDLNETFVVGTKVPQDAKDLIRCAHDSLARAIELCKPGVRFRDLGDVIAAHTKKCGFSVDRTYCGHGIGETFHQAPSIPHYAGNKAKGLMKPGHVFTIEPMINMVRARAEGALLLPFFPRRRGRPADNSRALRRRARRVRGVIGCGRMDGRRSRPTESPPPSSSTCCSSPRQELR